MAVVVCIPNPTVILSATGKSPPVDAPRSVPSAAVPKTSTNTVVSVSPRRSPILNKSVWSDDEPEEVVHYFGGGRMTVYSIQPSPPPFAFA